MRCEVYYFGFVSGPETLPFGYLTTGKVSVHGYRTVRNCEAGALRKLVFFFKQKQFAIVII